MSLEGISIEMREAESYTVRGRVTGWDEDSVRAKALTVRLSPGRFEESQAQSTRVLFDTESVGVGQIATSGEFQIAHLQPGTYTAVVETRAGEFVATQILTVSRRDLLNLVIPLAPAVQFAGKLQYLDPSAAGGRPQLILISLGPAGFRTAMVPVGEDGTFSKSGLGAGAYRAEVAGAKKPLFITSIAVGGKSFRGPGFELPSGGSAEVLVSAGTRGAGIEGRVTSRGRGEELAGGTVSAVPVPTTLLELAALETVAPDRNGFFFLSGLPPGTYRVCAWKESGDALVEILSAPQHQSRLDDLCVNVEAEAGMRRVAAPRLISVSDFPR